MKKEVSRFLEPFECYSKNKSTGEDWDTLYFEHHFQKVEFLELTEIDQFFLFFFSDNI